MSVGDDGVVAVGVAFLVVAFLVVAVLVVALADVDVFVVVVLVTFVVVSGGGTADALVVVVNLFRSGPHVHLSILSLTCWMFNSRT